jgi:3-hydroxyacyl-[acyl-carrier-protein] dehydratase
MILDVQLVKQKRGIWKFTGQASVDGKVVASAELMCAQQEIK